MEVKKSPKADLDSKRLTFALIGLVVSLFIVWRVFEIKSYDKRTLENLQRTVEIIEEEMVEITKQEAPKPQPPAPKPQATQIQVVEDDVEVEDEIDINAEVSQEEIIEEYVYEAPEIEEEEIVEAEIFTVVEQMPEFPGGAAEMTRFIQKNIKYPMMARESDIQGRVYINFVVEPDGSVSNVTVMRGIGGGCDEEAVRIVNMMPKWNPGKQRGVAVRCSFTVPIVFRLQ
ncbi:MAG TPA: energy transducer TonB [Bacteroidetes bacterium]|nr:energy transducer TonB [Candidatus Limimorpha avicola]